VSISQEDLFKLALNLQPPWYIASIDFDLEGKRLDIYIHFEHVNFHVLNVATLNAVFMIQSIGLGDI